MLILLKKWPFSAIIAVIVGEVRLFGPKIPFLALSNQGLPGVELQTDRTLERGENHSVSPLC